MDTLLIDTLLPQSSGVQRQCGPRAAAARESYLTTPTHLSPQTQTHKHTRATQAFNGIVDPEQPLRMNDVPIPFESELFSGVVSAIPLILLILRVAGGCLGVAGG